MYLRGKLEALIAGVKTRFLKLGHGSPLLVLPGLLGRDATPAAETASFTHEVYAPDPPGIRETQVPNEPVTMEFLARWIGALHTEAIGKRPLTLLGFSAGATAQIHYAATHPGAVERMVLFEPVIVGGQLPFWLKSFIVFTAVPGATSAILKIAPHLLPFLGGVNHVGYGKRFRLVEGVNSPKAAGEIARSLLRWDAREEIQSLEVPILIVRGSAGGELVPHESLKQIQRPNIHHLEIPGLGHLLGGKGQQQVVEAAREFLKPSRHV